MKKKIIIVLSIILIILLLVVLIPKPKKEKKSEEKPTEVKKQAPTPKEDLNVVTNELIAKIENFYLDYYSKYEEIDFESAGTSDTLLAAYAYSLKKNDGIFNKELVDKYYKELFNITLNEHEDLKCYVGDGILYKFDTQKNDYIEDCGTIEELCHSHGGLMLNEPLFIKDKEITKENDEYTLSVNKIYGLNIVDSDGYFYSDNEYKNRINELDSFLDNTKNEVGMPDINKINIEEVKKYYNDNYEILKEKLPIYKYTFKKENNNFYLVRIKKQVN